MRDTMMTYNEAVDYLLNIPRFSKKKTSPEALKDFLKDLGSPEKGQKIFHVAGTNGKGSVCACLTSILAEHGKSTGTFTSPHLIRVNERFAINKEPVDDDSFLDAFSTVYRTAQSREKKGFHCPTFFEFLFLMGMVLFSKKRVDYIVLETGLGGRLDATNVIDNPVVSVITSISLDHTQVLGSTVSAIAREKAGIIKKGVPVVFDASDPEAAEVIRKRCGEIGAGAYGLHPDTLILIEKHRAGQKFFVEGEKEILEIPFIPDYQRMNSALARKAIQIINEDNVFNEKTIAEGLKKTWWPARMEEARPGVYIDGAHNTGAMKEFVKTAREIMEQGDGSSYIIFAATEGKDYGGMIEELCRGLEFEAVMLPELDNTRILPLQKICEKFQSNTNKEVYKCQNAQKAWDRILQMKTENDKVFCVGSLYLAGAMEAVLRRNQNV